MFKYNEQCGKFCDGIDVNMVYMFYVNLEDCCSGGVYYCDCYDGFVFLVGFKK